jgi:hypothetical protein
VLSDGDNASPGLSGGSSGGDQTADDSTGSGQVGPAQVDAPVRVISDGDDGGGTTPGGSDPTPTDPTPSDSGSPTPSGGAKPADDTPSGDTFELVDDGDRPDEEPAAEVLSGGDGGAAPGDAPAGSVRVLGAQAGSLPVTGLGLLAMFAMGLVLMASGFALRRGGSEPK